MSAPITHTTTWTQPTFPVQGEETPGPTDGQQDPVKPPAPTKEKADWDAIIKFLFYAGLVALTIYMFADMWSRAAKAEEFPVSSSSQTCPSGQVEVDQRIPGDDYKACVSETKLGELLHKAAAQYDKAVTHGESIYDKWLAAHKLAPKTEAASEITAKRYICKMDASGDGSLYAASIAGINEGVVVYVVDGYVIRLAEYNPLDQPCSGGIPLQQKAPNGVPMPEGGGGINNGPVDGPQ